VAVHVAALVRVYPRENGLRLRFQRCADVAEGVMLWAVAGKVLALHASARLAHDDAYLPPHTGSPLLISHAVRFENRPHLFHVGRLSLLIPLQLLPQFVHVPLVRLPLALAGSRLNVSCSERGWIRAWGRERVD